MNECGHLVPIFDSQTFVFTPHVEAADETTSTEDESSTPSPTMILQPPGLQQVDVTLMTDVLTFLYQPKLLERLANPPRKHKKKKTASLIMHNTIFMFMSSVIF